MESPMFNKMETQVKLQDNMIENIKNQQEKDSRGLLD